MSIPGTSKKQGGGYWKGTCILCSTIITKSNSVSTGDPVAYGLRSPRVCRDQITCLDRTHKKTVKEHVAATLTA